MPLIGFFADVHGDLSAVLALLDRHPEVKDWFCVGDAVDMHRPVHYNAPVLRLLARRGIPSVLGNHDRAVLGRDARHLDAEAHAYLAALPVCLDLQFGALRIALIHATPTRLDTFVRPDDGEAAFRRHFGDVAADIVVLGHTHRPFDLTIGSTRFVNPGALSHPEAPSSFCLLNRDGTAAFGSLDG